MVFDMNADTDTALCVVFDPGALRQLHEPHPPPFPNADLIDDWAEAGIYVLIKTGDDGRYKFRAYVEEVPPPELLASAFHKVGNGLLRVPTGTLCAAGLEQVLFQGPPPGTVEAKVPAGDYQVEAFLIESNDDELADQNLGLVAYGCLGTVPLVALVFLFLATNDWDFQLPSAAIVFALALFWPPVIFANSRPAAVAARKKAAEEAAEAEAKELPGVVLHLRRLSEFENRVNLKGLLIEPREMQDEHLLEQRERERRGES